MDGWLVLVIGGACVAYLAYLAIPKASQREQANALQHRQLHPAESARDDFEDDLDDFEPSWETIKFRPKKEDRPEGYVGLTGYFDITLAGTNSRDSEARAFIDRAKSGDVTLTAIREPENPHDRNAIRIMGSDGRRSYWLGYIPARLASSIAEDVDPRVPIGAELRAAGIKVGGDAACFISVNLIQPCAKDRRKFLER